MVVTILRTAESPVSDAQTRDTVSLVEFVANDRVDGIAALPPIMPPGKLDDARRVDDAVNEPAGVTAASKPHGRGSRDASRGSAGNGDRKPLNGLDQVRVATFGYSSRCRSQHATHVRWELCC
jgi:hypothetical protein